MTKSASNRINDSRSVENKSLTERLKALVLKGIYMEFVMKKFVVLRLTSIE